MISYFHHLAAIGQRPDCLKLVATGEGLFPCRWHEHVQAWLKNPYEAEMITVSYEMLKKSGHGVAEDLRLLRPQA
jgi:hypothetical protein